VSNYAEACHDSPRVDCRIVGLPLGSVEEVRRHTFAPQNDGRRPRSMIHSSRSRTLSPLVVVGAGRHRQMTGETANNPSGHERERTGGLIGRAVSSRSPAPTRPRSCVARASGRGPAWRPPTRARRRKVGPGPSERGQRPISPPTFGGLSTRAALTEHPRNSRPGKRLKYPPSRANGHHPSSARWHFDAAWGVVRSQERPVIC